MTFAYMLIGLLWLPELVPLIRANPFVPMILARAIVPLNIV